MTFLGLDCGTSALKAVLVNDAERVVATGESVYLPDHPRSLWSEQDPGVWRDAMFAAISQVRAKAPREWAVLRAIGFSGQMHSAVLLGRDDRPVRPAMLHNDTRAHAEARELHERHNDLEAVVGVKPMAGFTAPKLMWVALHEPDVYARVAQVLLPKDYLRLVLTGERRCDMSDAAGTWWLDEAARAWSAPALAASGVDPALVPALVEGSDAVAGLAPGIAAELGVSRNVVIAAGGGDASVGATGLGAIRPGDAFISLGTASQLIVASDVYRAAPEKLVHSFAHALPGRWFRMAAMLNGAGAFAFAARLLGASVADLEREATENYGGPGAMLFLPYLSGERTPHDDPHARGVAFGMSEGSSRADFARSVMEGVAFTLADAKDCLEAAGDGLAQVGLIGGGAKSPLWTRMIAASLNREIVRYRGGETGPAFGAARLARLAATGEAPETLCRPPEVLDVTMPEAGLADQFAARRERFQSLYRSVKGEFVTSAPR